MAFSKCQSCGTNMCELCHKPAPWKGTLCKCLPDAPEEDGDGPKVALPRDYPRAMYKGDFDKPEYKEARSAEEETLLNGLGFVNGREFYAPKKGKK